MVELESQCHFKSFDHVIYAYGFSYIHNLFYMDSTSHENTAFFSINHNIIYLLIIFIIIYYI